MKFTILATLFALFSFNFSLLAQPYLVDNDEIDGLKKTKLYVVMATEETDINNAYVDVFKKYWTYCPYEIIEPKDISKYMKNRAYFMSMSVTYYEDAELYYLYTRYKFTYELSIYTPKISFLKK